MNNKTKYAYTTADWVGMILLIAMVILLVAEHTHIISDTTLEDTYKVVINPFSECEKGFCSMEGFTCLDASSDIFNYSTCQCMQEGYVCKG